MKTLFKNLFESYISTLAGSIAGIPQIIEGYTNHDLNKIVEGVCVFLLGIVVKEK